MYENCIEWFNGLRNLVKKNWTINVWESRFVAGNIVSMRLILMAYGALKAGFWFVNFPLGAIYKNVASPELP